MRANLVVDEQIEKAQVDIKVERQADIALDSSILASYTDIVEIGSGGFGKVYRANHKTLPGFVALKVVRQDLTDSHTAMKRLGLESRAITTLNHPNIVGVREFGTGSEGSAYLVMDFIDGITLRERLEQQELRPAEIIDIAIQICKGLLHAHTKKVLHRDLKPGNVMLTGAPFDAEGSVKLVDFGLAKMTDDGREQNVTQTGDIVGSPLYMSPEQGLGQVMDERSDIYSLGCVLYEMLAGCAPLRGDNAMQTILKHVNTMPDPPSKAAPDKKISKSLDALVLRSLAKDPQDRYQSVSSLLSDLELIKQGKTIQLPSGRAKQPSSKSSKTGTIVLAAVALVGVLFLTVLCAGVSVIAPMLNQPHWITEINHAKGLKMNGNRQLAKVVLVAANKEAEKDNAPDHDRAVVLGELAKVCRDDDSYKEAAVHYAKAVAFARKTTDKTILAEYLDDLGLSLNESGDSAAALLSGNEALKHKLDLYGENSFYTSNCLQKLAKTYYTLGQYENSEKSLKRAKEITLAIEGPVCLNMASIDWLLTKALLAQEKLPEADKYYKEAVEIRTSILGENDSTLALIKSIHNKLMAMDPPRLDTMLVGDLSKNHETPRNKADQATSNPKTSE